MAAHTSLLLHHLADFGAGIGLSARNNHARLRDAHWLREHGRVEHRVGVEVAVANGHAPLHLVLLIPEGLVRAILELRATGYSLLPLYLVPMGFLEADSCLVKLDLRWLWHSLVSKIANLDIEGVIILLLPLGNLRRFGSFVLR